MATLPPGTNTLTFQVTDAQGNIVSDTVEITVVDTGPADNQHCRSHCRVVSAQRLRGRFLQLRRYRDTVRELREPVQNGAPIDTSTLGSQTFTVTATDHSGNTRSLSINYTVVAPPDVPVEILWEFSDTWSPGGVIVGPDGHFYGGTAMGGAGGGGTLFRMTRAGQIQTLFAFNGANGAGPMGELVVGPDGHFYGTTRVGGTHNLGTIFRVTQGGLLTTLMSFDGSNGAEPLAALVVGPDGALYGTTSEGGDSNRGTVFKITTPASFERLFSFDGSNGWSAQAALVVGPGNDLYGTTVQGGLHGYGTVFKISPTGALETLVSFAQSDGAWPFAPLALTTDGDLYGTTSAGGAHDFGTIFKISASGAFSTVLSFDAFSSGGVPAGGLTLGPDGTLYGTTTGTVFNLLPNGALLTLGSFTGPNGKNPRGRLIEGPDGNLYAPRPGAARLGLSRAAMV